MTYTKNSVKLLPIIESFENSVVLYTEFDGNFSIGDKLYIMVLDSGSTDYVLDSFEYSSGTTLYSMIGYELLQKEGNKLTLDINYTNLALSGLTVDNCYIARVYIKSGSITRGVINGSILYNVSIVPLSTLNLIWYQGIVVTSPTGITHLDFNSNNEGNLILKSELLSNGIVNSFYTVNNYNNGLSIINLLNTTINLQYCNITSGIFNNCDLGAPNYTINNGIFNNCFIGPKYVINGGQFINSEIADGTVTWNNGTWESNDGTGNSYKAIIWSGGTWKNGIFPSTSSWVNGRFIKGVFNGTAWYNGTFGNKDSTITDTIFTGKTWFDGSFNGGLMDQAIFNNGTFNNGTISGSTWNNGTFNNGTFYSSIWNNGTFNNGIISGSTWNNGVFNDGTFIDSTWNNGVFNNGLFTSSIQDNSIWNNGYFYDGKFQNSIWNNGSFYKGSMFTSTWKDGDLFFGTMNNVGWSGGTWHNGIANDITFSGGTWLNGIFNQGTFYKGTWLNGSFNAGTFTGGTYSIWYSGNFYFGEFAGTWSGGTFYTGNMITSIPPQYIIGKEFKQYNKTGLIWKNLQKLKLPAKQRY